MVTWSPGFWLSQQAEAKIRPCGKPFWKAWYTARRKKKGIYHLVLKGSYIASDPLLKIQLEQLGFAKPRQKPLLNNLWCSC